MATASATASGIRTSRPSIFIGGMEDTSLSQGLLHLSVHEDVQGLYRCEARFGNWGPKNNDNDFLYFDRQKLDFGKAIQVKIEEDVIANGRISAMEANFPEGEPPDLSVLVEDRFQDLRMTRRTRTFDNATDSGVMTSIANDHGLQPNINISGPAYKVLVQVNQSDLAFLRERARAVEVELWMDDTKLYAQPRSGRTATPIKLAYGGDLISFSAMADLAGQRTSVTVSGWDVAGKSALKYDAGDSVISGELNGDDSGMSILKSAFGDRKESLAHTVPLNGQEAQSVAEAFLKMSARRFVVGRGVGQGNAKLRVGCTVELSALGPLFNGKYYVSEVRHTFSNADGYRTNFTAERPGIGKA
jgi:phage protein D